MAFLPVGKKAPEFSVNDQNGNLVKLSDLKGKKVVLYFYPKDMTPGCTAEACSLRDNYNVLLKQGYEVLGVSTDTEKSHQKFIAKEKLRFRLLADTDKKLHESYHTWIEKSMYGRSYMGTARVTYVINESGIIQEVIEKVNTKEHASQILGASPNIAKKSAQSEIAKKPAAKKVVKKTAKPVKKVAKKSSVKKKK